MCTLLEEWMKLDPNTCDVLGRLAEIPDLVKISLTDEQSARIQNAMTVLLDKFCDTITDTEVIRLVFPIPTFALFMNARRHVARQTRPRDNIVHLYKALTNNNYFLNAASRLLLRTQTMESALYTLRVMAGMQATRNAFYLRLSNPYTMPWLIAENIGMTSAILPGLSDCFPVYLHVGAVVLSREDWQSPELTALEAAIFMAICDGRVQQTRTKRLQNFLESCRQTWKTRLWEKQMSNCFTPFWVSIPNDKTDDDEGLEELTHTDKFTLHKDNVGESQVCLEICMTTGMTWILDSPDQQHVVIHYLPDNEIEWVEFSSKSMLFLHESVYERVIPEFLGSSCKIYIQHVCFLGTLLGVRDSMESEGLYVFTDVRFPLQKAPYDWIKPQTHIMVQDDIYGKLENRDGQWVATLCKPLTNGFYSFRIYGRPVLAYFTSTLLPNDFYVTQFSVDPSSWSILCRMILRLDIPDSLENQINGPLLQDEESRSIIEDMCSCVLPNENDATLHVQLALESLKTKVDLCLETPPSLQIVHVQEKKLLAPLYTKTSQVCPVCQDSILPATMWSVPDDSVVRPDLVKLSCCRTVMHTLCCKHLPRCPVCRNTAFHLTPHVVHQSVLL